MQNIISKYTPEQWEAAVKAEARAHAEFFGHADDVEAIEARERVTRYNVAYVRRTGKEPELLNSLIEFLPIVDAAPELLSVCEWMEDFILACNENRVTQEHADLYSSMMKLARATIVKANGRR